MELRQLGQKDSKKGDCVDKEVSGIIFGVKAGQNVPARRQNIMVAFTNGQYEEETLWCGVIQ